MTTLPCRRLYVSMMTSLDGFIEGPERELDWFDNDNPAFQSYCQEMMDSVGLAIYGRRAYELMVQYWPRAELHPRSALDLAFAQRMNALPKLVLSRTLRDAAWNNTRIVRDAQELAALKREPGRPIVAWAGAALVATLTQLGLVDEYRFVVHPVALGHGTPAFAQPIRLRQVRTQTLGGRLSVLCYEPDR
jgi:dihydrofolate reductase